MHVHWKSVILTDRRDLTTISFLSVQLQCCSGNEVDYIFNFCYNAAFLFDPYIPHQCSCASGVRACGSCFTARNGYPSCQQRSCQRWISFQFSRISPLFFNHDANVFLSNQIFFLKEWCKRELFIIKTSTCLCENCYKCKKSLSLSLANYKKPLSIVKITITSLTFP